MQSIEARTEANPSDFAAWNELADARLRLLRSTGDMTYLRGAKEAVEHSLETAAPDNNRSGLAMLACVQLAGHRFAEARQSAEELRARMPGQAYPARLLGDALFSLGDYDEAAQYWKEAAQIEDEPSANESRLAQLDLVYGRVEQARERLAKALEFVKGLRPPSPDRVVSIRVQLGEMAFRSGDWETAQAQYQAALQSAPDDYATLEHLAELRGAQGRNDEAISLYTRILARAVNPELMQALGDLSVLIGKPEEGKHWHEKALASYLASVEAGEVLYFHHLSSFYSDSMNEPGKAVEWARRDLELRHTIQAYDALAWSLSKAGKTGEAVEAMNKALATGTRDAHILYHAAMIRMGAGDITGGKAALQQALAANPRYNSFHVHR